MGFENRMVSINLLMKEEEKNRELYKQVKQLYQENQRLSQENSSLRETLTHLYAGRKMANYLNNIRQGYMKPAYKGNITTDDIVTAIYCEGITDLQKVADKLNTSYSTVLRRLKANKLYPIDKEDIYSYYKLFCTNEND